MELCKSKEEEKSLHLVLFNFFLTIGYTKGTKKAGKNFKRCLSVVATSSTNMLNQSIINPSEPS